MNKELYEIWKNLNTRITTINDRNKQHTLDIRELRKQINEIRKNKK